MEAEQLVENDRIKIVERLSKQFWELVDQEHKLGKKHDPKLSARIDKIQAALLKLKSTNNKQQS